MTTLADLFATPKSIDFEGTSYKLRPPTQVEQGLFAVYLEERAAAFAGRRATEEERAEYRRIAMIEGASGTYDWGSDAYTVALRRPVTLAKMIAFILMGANPGLASAPDEADRIALHLVTQRIVQIAAVIGAENEPDDAKKKAILEAVGLPPTFLNSEPGSNTPSTSPSPVPSPSAEASKPSGE